MKKRILIIFSGLLLVAVVAAGTFNYYIKPKYVSPALVAMEELLGDEEMMDLLLEEYGQDSLEVEIAGEDSTEKLAEGSSEELNESKDQETNNLAGEKDTEEKKKETKDADEKKSGKTVTELQKEVNPSDLSSGLKIASKIDTGHLLGLYKGGLTPENKKAAKSHLTGRLTPGEISELRGLVGKYSHLLK